MTPHEKIYDFYSRLSRGEVAQIGGSLVVQYRWQDGNVEYRTLLGWPDSSWNQWRVDQAAWNWFCGIAVNQNIVWLPNPEPQQSPTSHIRKVEL